MPTTLTPRRAAATIAAALAIGAVAAAPATASPAAPVQAESNIVETAVAAGNFQTLASLLQRAGLAETLAGPGPYTVFAPTDAAFKKVPKRTLAALGQNKAMLKSVLLYHVAQGRLPAKRVAQRTSIKTLNGERVRIRVRGDNVLANNAKVITADVQASNGVIHAINQVLIP